MIGGSERCARSQPGENTRMRAIESHRTTYPYSRSSRQSLAVQFAPNCHDGSQ
jgi:hypothetical protein